MIILQLCNIAIQVFIIYFMLKIYSTLNERISSLRDLIDYISKEIIIYKSKTSKDIQDKNE